MSFPHRRSAKRDWSIKFRFQKHDHIRIHPVCSKFSPRISARCPSALCRPCDKTINRFLIKPCFIKSGEKKNIIRYQALNSGIPEFRLLIKSSPVIPGKHFCLACICLVHACPARTETALFRRNKAGTCNNTTKMKRISNITVMTMILPESSINQHCAGANFP